MIIGMRFILLKVVWVAGVSFVSLISAWCVPVTQRKSSVLQTARCAAANDQNWEEQARNRATDILQSVLNPENATTVERAVKVALRSIHNGKLRKRVSQLVLGTSIMRKRHEYIYNVTRKSCVDDHTDKIMYMVDLHATYLENNADDTQNITWPTDSVERIALQYSMPSFLVQAWLEEYGAEEAEALCNVANKPGPITLRRNAVRCSSDEALVSRLTAEEGVTLSPPTFTVPGCLRITSGRPRSIWAMSAWKDGWFEVQDVGSQMIVAATKLDANDNVVVDYCAGNGGKSLAMLSHLHQLNIGATIWAHDVEELRLAQLRGSLSRAGVANTATQLLTTSCADEDLHIEMADIVLVDAPCSSCGVLRRRPSHRWELTREAMENDLPELQLEILMNASRLVKPGGRLVYATCSVCRCENENVAAAWESEVLSLSSWEPWPFNAESWPIPLQHPLPAHYCKLLPHKHDSDGFFIARWTRRQE